MLIELMVFIMFFVVAKADNVNFVVAFDDDIVDVYLVFCGCYCL